MYIANGVTYSYVNAHRNIFNTIKMSGHSFFRKIYLSLYLKGFERYYLWEVSWRLNRTATYWPPNSSGYSSISFPFSWAAQLGAWGPNLCWDMVLIPASSLQLIWTSCRTGLYNNLMPTYFLRASHLYSIQPVDSQGYPLISSTGCTCYLHRCISHLTARLGRRSTCYNGTKILCYNWLFFFFFWSALCVISTF